MTRRVLILPGLFNSGPDHWQSHWQQREPAFVRVMQRDWETPRRSEWVETLDRAVDQYGSEAVLVAHSSSCALVAFWARDTRRSAKGALLVAPSDTEASSYPRGPTGWAPMPLEPIPFPTIVVASTDDEYVTLDRAESFARSWGSRLVNVGALGHINSASGLGDWPAGRALLAELLEH